MRQERNGIQVRGDSRQAIRTLRLIQNINKHCVVTPLCLESYNYNIYSSLLRKFLNLFYFWCIPLSKLLQNNNYRTFMLVFKSSGKKLKIFKSSSQFLLYLFKIKNYINHSVLSSSGFSILYINHIIF